MHHIAAILLFFLLSLNGCGNYSVSDRKEVSKKGNPVLVGDLEANLMKLYSAAADTRYAVQQESTVCTTGPCVRILPNRTRTVSNTNTRQVLLSTHKPAVSRLMRHSVIQLIAFPKEYHIFRLRRILI